MQGKETESSPPISEDQCSAALRAVARSTSDALTTVGKHDASSPRPSARPITCAAAGTRRHAAGRTAMTVGRTARHHGPRQAPAAAYRHLARRRDAGRAQSVCTGSVITNVVPVPGSTLSDNDPCPRSRRRRRQLLAFDRIVAERYRQRPEEINARAGRAIQAGVSDPELHDGVCATASYDDSSSPSLPPRWRRAVARRRRSAGAGSRS